MRILCAIWTLCFVCLGARAAAAEAMTWTLTNHAGDYQNELVRLGVKAPRGADSESLLVTEDGKPVPCQVEGDAIWVATTIAGKASHTYQVVEGRSPPKFEPLVTVTKETGRGFVLDNGLVAVEVPAAWDFGEIPGPITAVRPAGGKWVGGSAWKTGLALKALRTEVLGRGPLFAKVRLRWEFDGQGGTFGDVPAFAEVAVTLKPGQPLAHVEESHEMAPGDSWTLECTRNWAARQGFMQRWRNAPFKGDEALHEIPLTPGQTRLGETLMYLQPRWTQAFDEGWFFAAADARHLVGAIPARAGRWYWGHDNLLAVRLKAGGDYAGLECPTWRGRRCWLLVAGERGLAPQARDLVLRAAMQPLDKLTHEYILDWPGQEPGGFRGEFFYTGATDPTGGRRGMGRNALANAGKGKADRRTLAAVQVNLDPDWFCGYWQKWSPINPNFYTDFIKYPVGESCNLKGHPRFREIARMVEEAVRTDLHHSVTLPGGAGQECPGYLAHAMGSWKEMAPVCKANLGFDITAWPQYKAGASFLAHLSQPAGGGKREFHPGGDTHPGRPDPIGFAREFGVDVDVRRLQTEELPGFGVVFRNSPGTDRETYLAFKSGPSRGHYHGDQLSFHYCAGARPLAVDHHCSYKPRAGQEHMHNRVAFHTDDWPYANMDGYERVVAFKTSPASAAGGPGADVAVGQVESPRLRRQLKHPPEDWDAVGPYKWFDTPLVYRRTVVLVKGGPEDYFVLRDQYWGPPVTAVYCLHVLGDRCRVKGTPATIEFEGLTLFCAHPGPEAFKFETFPWEHDNGGLERTAGARLSTKGRAAEFVTVLYPGTKPPAMKAVPGGVQVGGDEIIFAGSEPGAGGPETAVTVKRDGRTILALEGREIDLERSQGEVGLFVPDCGYDFGPIPDWLIRQRDRLPEWKQ